MILDEVIIAIQNSGEKLSRLAVVNRKWQERVEEITFAKLGGFPGPSNDTCSICFSLRATDLHDFERIMVGKRRTLLRHIEIDFNLDAEGIPELHAYATMYELN